MKCLELLDDMKGFDFKKIVKVDELFLYHQPNNYYVFLLYNFERVYQTVADKMKKLSTEIIDEKAMLKKHKVVTDFFSTTIELTSMGRQFKKICL